MCLSILFYVTCITRIRFLPPSTCTIISLWNKKKKRICNIQFISYNLFFDTFYSPLARSHKNICCMKNKSMSVQVPFMAFFWYIFLCWYDVMIMMYLDLSQCISNVSAKLNDDRARMSSKYGYQILAESIYIFHIFTRSIHVYDTLTLFQSNKKNG